MQKQTKMGFLPRGSAGSGVFLHPSIDTDASVDFVCRCVQGQKCVPSAAQVLVFLNGDAVLMALLLSLSACRAVDEQNLSLHVPRDLHCVKPIHI